MNLSFLLLLFQFQPFEIRGYFEYQGQETRESDYYFYSSYNRLNLTLRGKFNSLYFRTDLVYTDYNGRVRYDLRDYIPAPIYPEVQIPYYLRSGLYMRNGFLRVTLGPLMAQAGRQQIGWGTGYLYNPTNVFQIKSILDPSYELDGVDALNLTLHFSPLSNVEVLFLPGDTWESSARGGRIRGNLFESLDLSVGYLLYQRELIDPLTLSPGKRETEIVAGDFSGELLGLGVHGEATYNTRKKEMISLLGMDYTLRDGVTSLLLEYLSNGEGRTEGNYTLADWLNYLMGATLSMGKREIFFDLQRIMGFHTLHLSFLVNPDDMSGIILPRLDLSLNDNTQVILAPFLTFGKMGEEYATLPDGLFFRLRYSF